MAALVQTIPQQTATVPLLQTLPTASPSTYTTSIQLPQHSGSRNQTMAWNSYNTSGSAGNLRGTGVVAPYAFTSTPTLSAPASPARQASWAPQLRPEQPTSSAPSTSSSASNLNSDSKFSHHTAAGSVSSSSTSSLRSHPSSKDDSALPSKKLTNEGLRPLSIAGVPTGPSTNISSPTVARPSPDRYRRGNRRTESTQGNPAAASGLSASPSLPTVTVDGQTSHVDSPAPHISATSRPQGHQRVASADGTTRSDKSSTLELAKRYRRRSWATMDTATLANLPMQMPGSHSPAPMPHDFRPFDFTVPPRPHSAHSQRGSPSSIHSRQSSNESKRETTTAVSTKSETGKRSNKSSPLSNPSPAAANDMSSGRLGSAQLKTGDRNAPHAAPESPASKRLAENLRNNEAKKGKGRLRRAFSFGSASELLKASTQSSASKREAFAAEQARRERLKEELGDEQAAIAVQQEASGLGESIYSNSNFYTGSTDNVSVSSTASSASIMLRKMGRGMKRSTRSLVGLFRPRSFVSTTSPDGAAAEEPMAPQVSIVNIEADRKATSVTADSQDLAHGAPVSPKAEMPQTPTGKAGSVREVREVETSQARKSIVGGDKERAEILAAVRKGILKKTQSDPGASSPLVRPVDTGSDSPHSSAPSTPDDQTRSEQRRRVSVTIAGEDYFLSEGRFNGHQAKSAPITPQPARNIVFSPRIQFHETWPSGEYDRRGEIATCNRLTPLLAQQIKEELNNFKMEMEVHETSKIYTHFL